MKWYIHIDDVYRLIAGHSNYHGDDILSALTRIAEGKKVTKPITPIDKEEIKIGDEIRVGIEGRNAFNVVVFLVGKRPDGVTVYQCMSSGGNHFIYTSEDNIRKTGKHYPHVEELQKAMKEEKT